jgi:hypothetical protein
MHCDETRGASGNHVNRNARKTSVAACDEEEEVTSTEVFGIV